MVVAVDLVNGLTLTRAGGRPVTTPLSAPTGTQDAEAVIGRMLVVDPPSLDQLSGADVPGFVTLAGRLREVFVNLDGGDVDTAAQRLNDMLAEHPAAPHLAKEDGRWRMHHHPVDLALVAMWTSICAEAVARMIGTGHHDRFGTCQAPDCDRVYVDLTRNASRRFCSTACQNRVKATAFRQRRVARPPLSQHTGRGRGRASRPARP